MNSFFDRQEIWIPCLRCKSKSKRTIGELKRSSVKCPKCGAPLGTTHFKQAVDKAERSVQALPGKLKGVKVNIKL